MEIRTQLIRARPGDIERDTLTGFRRGLQANVEAQVHGYRDHPRLLRLNRELQAPGFHLTAILPTPPTRLCDILARQDLGHYAAAVGGGEHRLPARNGCHRPLKLRLNQRATGQYGGFHRQGRRYRVALNIPTRMPGVRQRTQRRGKLTGIGCSHKGSAGFIRHALQTRAFLNGDVKAHDMHGKIETVLLQHPGQRAGVGIAGFQAIRHQDDGGRLLAVIQRQRGVFH